MNEPIDPTFSGFLKASGQTTIWDKKDRDRLEKLKWAELKTYADGILIYNWNEDKFDLKSMCQRTPLPSQFDHYYKTMYRSSFNKGPRKVPEDLKCPSKAYT